MRFVRDPSLRFVAAATALAAAVSGGALALGASSPEPLPAPATTAPPPPPPAADVTCPDAGGMVEALRGCLDRSLVFVDTPAGSGTGVLLDTGEIVTNAHVIDPFDLADIVLVGGERFDDVPVIGVDLADDIALLGPIDAGAGLTLAAEFPALEEVGPLYLVGFPLGAEGNDPQLGISTGILSRLRRYEEFDQTLLQSDAEIAGGQSGGALVDGSGRLLGISGYYYDGFSFSLSVGDVIEAVDAIRGGRGSGRLVIPDAIAEWEPEYPLTFVGADSTRRLLVAPADEVRSARIRVDTDAYSVEAYDFDGRSLLSYYAYDDEFDEELAFEEDEYDDSAITDWYTEIGDPYGYGTYTEPDADGALTFEIPAGSPVTIDISSTETGLIDVELDLPHVVVDSLLQGAEIEVGDTISGELDFVRSRVAHEIRLERGDRIEITARGAPTHPDVWLYSPEEEPEATYTFDSGFASGPGAFYGIGFIDEPFTHTFEIERAGTFTIVVQSGFPTEYRLTVTPAEKPDR